ncbi:MAG: coproporphyrinogen dehydrogenase HemZ [Lachnospiraceae bacterium]|nr:coproporphyrinogen dehydrogenase HemZ [Lachnospiraceae bacterium]
MRKVEIQLNKSDFEYDVHSLTKAFYPEDEVKVVSPQMGSSDVSSDVQIILDYQESQIGITCTETGQCRYQKVIALDYYKERTETKNQLKRLLYKALREVTGKELPWGTLSGIRPTKIPMKMLESGMTNVQIAQYMRETYYTNNAKTALAIAVANREKYILKDIDYENGYSLYIGIPFCPSICLYCSFSSSPLKLWEKRVDEYLDALCKELTASAKMLSSRKLNTIYIGGGTPTTLNPKQLERLLSHVEKEFDFSSLLEYTVEAGRPDSITQEKLQAIKKHPVTRISVNPQTMNQSTLDLIGRRHTVEDTIHAFYLAREAGFDNINMDLIVGLPGEDESMVAHTLEEIQKLDPDSLTVHSLAVKRATRLHLFREQYQEMSFENNQKIMDMVADCARSLDMGPYYLYRQKNMKGNLENVGYAKVDKAGIYNILIMEEKQTILAAGAGASTKMVFDHGTRIERTENVKDVKQYLERIDEMIERKRTGIEMYLKG